MDFHIAVWMCATTEAFDMNVRRAHIQTAIWKSACEAEPPKLDPTVYGWKRDDISKSLELVHLPTNVALAPQDVLEIIHCGCLSEKPCLTAQCRCNSARLPCTMFCRPQAARMKRRWLVLERKMTKLMMSSRMLSAFIHAGTAQCTCTHRIIQTY